MAKRYFLVDGDALPEVFLRVASAKEMLSNGTAKNMSQAARLSGLSRSAFYKYKDKVFDVSTQSASVALTVRLKDEPGTLQKLLSVISGAGSNISSVSQVSMDGGLAVVSLMCRTSGMVRTMDEVVADISHLPEVLDVQRAVQNITDLLP